MGSLSDEALEQIGYLDLIIEELHKRHFSSKSIAFPSLCALRLRNSIKSVKLLVEVNLVHDAMGALRSALEVVILIVGYYRIDNFSRRRHVDFLKDKKDLLVVRLENNIYRPPENAQTLQEQIDSIQEEIRQNRENGIEPFQNIHSVANLCGMLSFKKHFYKLLCINTHPSNTVLSKYADENTPINLINNPEADDTGHISEGVFNCIVIAASILDENLRLGTSLKSIDEYLADLYSE